MTVQKVADGDTIFTDITADGAMTVLNDAPVLLKKSSSPSNKDITITGITIGREMNTSITAVVMSNVPALGNVYEIKLESRFAPYKTALIYTIPSSNIVHSINLVSSSSFDFYECVSVKYLFMNKAFDEYGGEFENGSIKYYKVFDKNDHETPDYFSENAEATLKTSDATINFKCSRHGGKIQEKGYYPVLSLGIKNIELSKKAYQESMSNPSHYEDQRINDLFR